MKQDIAIVKQQSSPAPHATYLPVFPVTLFDITIPHLADLTLVNDLLATLEEKTVLMRYRDVYFTVASIHINSVELSRQDGRCIRVKFFTSDCRTKKLCFRSGDTYHAVLFGITEQARNLLQALATFTTTD